MALTKVSAAMFSTAAQSSDMNMDDGTLFVDVSENKVGIGNTAPAEALDITGNLTLRSRGYLKLQDDTGGQFVALRAPATVSGSVTYTFPAADGSSGQSLTTDGSGTLAWSAAAPTAGTGVTVSGSQVSIGQAVATSSNVQFNSVKTTLIEYTDGDDAITIADGGHITAAGNVIVTGNLTVNGSTVTNSATNTTIEDLLIELGTGTSGSPASDAGLVLERGSSDNIFIGWDESADVFTVGTGSFTGASTGNLTHTAANAVFGSITGTSITGSSLTIDTATLVVDASNNRVGIGNASPDVSLDIGSYTDAVHVPVGTTAQRPGSPAAGYFRYNSTTSQFEGYTSSWGAIGGGSTTLNTDLFTGNGSTVDFTISQAIDNENKLMVFIDGVYQNPDAYSMPANTTLRFTAAPANSRKIAVYSIAGVVSGTNLNIDSFTGDGSDLTFTLSITPVSENNTLVYVGGVYQQKSVYSVSGTTLTFGSGNAPPNGASIEVATFNQTNINVPVDDTITTAKIVDANVTTAKIADVNVTTAKITDNAVTLAKMAGIARGKIIYGDASGNPAVLTAGGAGTVLTSDGTDISWAEEVATNYLPLAGGTLTGATTINGGSPALVISNSGDAKINLVRSSNTITYSMSTAGSGGHGFYDNAASSYDLYMKAGKVGIGETTPLGHLHVKSADSGGSVDGGTDELVLEGSGNSGMTILSGASNTGSIYFGDSGSTWDGYIAYSHASREMTVAAAQGGNYIKLDTTGSVGFSSTPTAWGSGYKSIQIGDRGFVAAHTGSDLYIGQNAYHNSGWKYEASVAASLTQHSGGQITHKVAAAGTAGNAITWIDALHIKADGSVGIGTTSPDTLLDIEYIASNHTQGIHITNSQPGGYGSAITFISERSDNNSLEVAARIRTQGQTAWNSGSTENSQLIFSVDSASTLSDRMFLNYRGALKVRAGDSLSTFASGSDYTHEIWQDQAGYASLKVASSGGTTNQYCLMVDMADDVTNTANWFQRCMAGTDSRFYIYSNGDVYTKTGTDIQQSSDRRLKDNITDYSGGLTVLKSLTPRTYTWKEGQGAAGTQYGFVAQEIEESSEVVDNMNLFSIVTATRDDDKNPLQPDDKQYNTQLSSKDAIYVSAIQELSKEIETLKAEIKALKD